jgi:hypothetical protein
MSCSQAGDTPVARQLTLILTTSPTPSAPSTELVDAILKSFQQHCRALIACRVIVVFDTYDRIAAEERLKKGQITLAGAKHLDTYKSNVKNLVLQSFLQAASHDALHERLEDAEYGHGNVATHSIPLLVTSSTRQRVIFIEPTRRLGFGLAVRSALRLVETPYVWIQQHDWPLATTIPLGPLLDIMTKSQSDELIPVNYICLPSVRMLSYATSAHVMQFPALRELTASLKRSFTSTSDGVEVSIPLTPLFFWHDKPHIASTTHYLKRVFPSRLAIPRGAFIEDTIGHRARDQMKEGQWSKWACWLYYPDDGERLCLRHLNGRKWRGAEEELLAKQRWKDLNAANTRPP